MRRQDQDDETRDHPDVVRSMPGGLGAAGLTNARVVAVSADARHRLLRAGSLDSVDTAGFEALRAAGVTTIIDLREPSEVDPMVAFADRGVTTHHVPLYDLPDGPPRTGAVTEVYEFLLTHRGPQIVEVVRRIAEAPGSALIHCTLGKDRTGLIVALSRSVGGHDTGTIVADYAASAAQLPSSQRQMIIARVRAEAPDAATAESALALHLTSPAEAMQHVLAELEDRHGGACAYLRAQGAEVRTLTALGRRLGRP